MLGTRLTLDDDLATAATGAARLGKQLAISASGCNGQRRDGHIGILGTCGKEGCALGTETRRVGGVLLIAANDLDTVFKKDGSTHTEVGVGGITALSGLDG